MMKPLTFLRLWLVVLGCTLTSAGTLHAQTVVFVDADATGPTHDGSSWCNAYQELPSALGVAASNTVIRVANGTYVPDASGLGDSREATFAMVNGVAIEGGYAGCGAIDPDERDLTLHETILSCDLNGNDGNVALFDGFADCYTGASFTATAPCASFDQNGDNTIDGVDFGLLALALGYSDNCYHVVTSSGNTASASLDGCTISGGNATGVNEHRNGGGVYAVVGGPTLTSCVWTANIAVNGGGAYNDLNSQALFQDCTFRSNFSYAGSAGGFGGGALNFNGQPTFTRCTFQSNGSGNGGGMFTQNSSAGLQDALFLGNRAGFGGGLYTSSSNPDVANTLFSGNAALIEGGGMRAVGGNVEITNCAFATNDGRFGGGGVTSLSSTITVTNSILWGNTAGAGTLESAQFDADAGTVLIRSTCMQGLSQYTGSNNISGDPLFVDALGDDGLAGTIDDDLHLAAASPCIDAGNNADVVTVNDLDGNDRVLDGDDNGTFVVDMGPYERAFVPSPACFSVRDLSVPRASYEPGVTKTIHVVLQPDFDTTALGVEDAPPPGWVDVGSISNGGSYDAGAHKVKWGPLFGPPFPVELTYEVTPPTEADGEVCFNGVSSANGDKNEPTCGDLCIEALPCPFLPADEPQAACPAGCADCSCGTCGDGRVELCEMIGYACAWQSGCNDDIAAMTRAAFLWQRGEFHCWSESSMNWDSLPAAPVVPGCCATASFGGGIAGVSHVRPSRDLQVTNRPRTNRAVVHSLDVRNLGRSKVVNIPIKVYADASTVAVGLEMEVPEYWVVTSISDGGQWDDINRKVKWGPYFEDLSRVVRFSARTTDTKASLSGFDGTVSFDGFNEPIIFTPTRRQ